MNEKHTTMNWKDKTIFTGDNLPIMRGMNSESVDLIYLDPPFNSNANYAAPIGSAAAGAEFGVGPTEYFTMKKTGSRLLFYVFLIFIVLGCAKSRPYPIKLDLSGHVRPEAVRYLHGIGITLGNYRDLSSDGIYEAQTTPMILHGNRITYIVKGDVEGNLFAMVLKMEVENANGAVQTKQFLTIMLAEIYKAIDAGEVPLEIMQALMRHYRIYHKFEWKISDDYYLTLSWGAKVWDATPDDPFDLTITIRRALN